MPLVSIRARYDGEKIDLSEPAPVDDTYEVLVTFLHPVEGNGEERDLPRFMRSFGAWQDERPVEATLQDIREARTSKDEAPRL